jgi:Putative prokaryotic signal transducing protein
MHQPPGFLHILRYPEGMAQDPDRDEEQAGGEVDTSHDLDLVSLYSSHNIEAEMEAEVLRSILEANDIPSVLSSSPLSPLEFDVKVPRNRLEDARRIIAEQRAAGPQAAAEAEAAGEENR